MATEDTVVDGVLFRASARSAVLTVILDAVAVVRASGGGSEPRGRLPAAVSQGGWWGGKTERNARCVRPHGSDQRRLAKLRGCVEREREGETWGGESGVRATAVVACASYETRSPGSGLAVCLG